MNIINRWSTGIVACLILHLCCMGTLLHAETVDFDVAGKVPAIQQPSSSTCWAAAATIMYSWKSENVLPIGTVMAKAGSDYVSKVAANDGLSGAEKPFFLKTLGLKLGAPQSYAAAGWKSMLQNYGPLWVTSNEGGKAFSVHARIVVGIHGDGSSDATFLKIVDPADASVSSESMATFIKKFEDVAKVDVGSGADLRPQVVHF
jgi:hypothetical protein